MSSYTNYIYALGGKMFLPEWVTMQRHMNTSNCISEPKFMTICQLCSGLEKLFFGSLLQVGYG